jgi:hypothetical protein
MSDDSIFLATCIAVGSHVRNFVETACGEMGLMGEDILDNYDPDSRLYRNLNEAIQNCKRMDDKYLLMDCIGDIIYDDKDTLMDLSGDRIHDEAMTIKKDFPQYSREYICRTIAEQMMRTVGAPFDLALMELVKKHWTEEKENA